MEPSALQRPAPAAWYLVHTKPRQEALALEHLQRQGYTAYLPLIWVEKVRRNKAVTLQQATFARYLFIHLETGLQSKSWAPIQSTQGVARLVRFGLSPARVPDALIDALRAREQVADVVKLFQPGDSVVITQGPFAGLQAIYQISDAEQRAVVLLDILTRRVPLTIDAGGLRSSAD